VTKSRPDSTADVMSKDPPMRSMTPETRTIWIAKRDRDSERSYSYRYGRHLPDYLVELAGVVKHSRDLCNPQGFGGSCFAFALLDIPYKKQVSA
jgi:hypothetical protein